jgi:hypothetical protein
LPEKQPTKHHEILMKSHHPLDDHQEHDHQQRDLRALNIPTHHGSHRPEEIHVKIEKVIRWIRRTSKRIIDEKVERHEKNKKDHAAEHNGDPAAPTEEALDQALDLII